MEYKIEVRGIMEYGQRVDANGQPHQEDCTYPELGVLDDKGNLFIVCDGMGGHASGEVASQTVCKTMGTILEELSPEDTPIDNTTIEQAVAKALEEMDSIYATQNQSAKKMGTTMTLLKLHRQGATIAHIGDSRVYHIRPGKNADDTRILFQTRDHSLVNDLVAIGEMTPEEALTSPRRNVITRAMQPDMDMPPKADIHIVDDVRVGDYFYLCTDGMLESMDENMLRFHFSEKAGDIDAKVTGLRDATADNRDNHTAILVHILDVIQPGTTQTYTDTTDGKHCKRLWKVLAIIVAALAVVGTASFFGLKKYCEVKNSTECACCKIVANPLQIFK